MFKDGRTNVHDEQPCGQPSVVSDDLVQSERWCFTISELSREFLQISRTFLREIFTVRLGYHKFCARWISKMLTGAHKTQRMASVLTFLQQYHKEGDDFLNHIVLGDETWVAFVNVETKGLSKQWMNTHSPNKPRQLDSLNKHCLPAIKLMATVFWDRTGKEC
jgi:hypothetical protein